MIKKIFSKIIYENAWIRLREDQVEFPGGKTGIYAYTERVDAGPMIIPVTAGGKLVVLREWRYPIQDWTYCFPFGGIMPGEDVLSAAKRELAEETGYVAENWKSLGQLKIDPGANAQVTPVFLATEMKLDLFEQDTTEVHQVVEFTPEEIQGKIRSGEIDNGWLVAGFAKYLIYNGWISSKFLS